MRLFKKFSFYYLLLILLSYFVYSDDNCIVIYGDTRSGHEVHKKIVKQIEDLSPAIVFHTGDLVNDGLNKADWDTFNLITDNLRKKTKFYPTLGNHERNSVYYFDNFELPNNERWYSIDYKDIHFIVLDSTSPLDSMSEQYSWLSNDLKNLSPKTRYIISIFHHPIYSSGKRKEDERNLRAAVIPILEKYKAQAVFSGHDHFYERSEFNNMYYVIAGSAGAPLYQKMKENIYSKKYLSVYHYCKLILKENLISVVVYDEDKNIIDEFNIKPFK